MNLQELLDRFCESRHRWLIVTGVTFVLALLTVWPLVDQYRALAADESEKTAELAQVAATTAQLPALSERAEQFSSELAELEQRTLRDSSVAGFRSRLVGFARESGCQVRRVGVGEVRKRRWQEGDHPLRVASEKDGRDTPFNLETRPVTLSVTGTNDQIRNLITKIKQSDVLMHAKRLEFHNQDRSGNSIQMDLELWCFALVRAAGGAA